MAAIFDDLETKLDDLDLDRLENGLAKDLIPDNCLDPTPRGKLDSNTSHINMSLMDNNELWQQCYIYRPEKGQYRMYDEASGQMLLSATRTNLGDYLISRYEDFPEQYAESTSSTAAKMWSSLSGTPQAHQTSGHEKSTTTSRLPKYVATMRLNSARNGYKLYTSSCELCDEALQKFSCTGTSLEAKPRVTAGISPYTVPASGASTTSPRSNSTRRNSGSGFASYGDDANRHQVDPDEDRQLLAVITQSMNVIDGTDIPARYMTFEIPGFLDSCGKTHKEQSRIVWCPRTLNNATKAETPAQVQQRLTHCDVRMRRGSIVTDPAYTTGGAASPGRSRRMSTLFTEKVSDQERLRYKVRLPSWSDDIGSLVLTFHGNRVLQPSAKNFMMIEDSTESIDGGNDPRLVFQFGKVNRDRFNLDFKYPVSPLQAFALALSSFKFTAK